MAYVAIARKWRPQSFEDLIGQDAIVQTLKNAIRLERVSHAYLFSGARGVGKTSVARIFAKALRCPNASQGEPCNRCEECTAIAESRSVDVSEIDGASYNGVEAVRSIRDNVSYTASSGFYRIYIIDEVHMLSLSAFNALLKTLEEPPAHVVFLFATTEVQKIPITILSRCQRFEFRRLTQSQIVQRLKYVLKEENFAITEAGLSLIASSADGSLRDALSLLDQVLSYGGESKEAEITEKTILSALGISSQSDSLLLLEAIADKATDSILKQIEMVFQNGRDLKLFAEKMLEDIRWLFLFRLNGNAVSADQMDLSSDQAALIKRISDKFSLVHIERMAQIFSKAIQQMHWSHLPRFLFEMAAIRASQLDQLDTIEKTLSHEGVPVASQQPVAFKMPPQPTGPIITSDAYEPPPTPITNKPVMPQQQVQPQPPPAVFSAPRPMPPQAPQPREIGQWTEFIQFVMKKRPLLGSLLHHGEFSKKAENTVSISFAAGSFYEKQSADAKNRTEIEKFLKEFFGKDTRLEIGASAQPGGPNSLEKMKQEESEKHKQDALENPVVHQFRDVLGADIVDIRTET